MRITVLVENTGPSEFKIEHGLSLYIEFNEKSIYWMLVRVIAFLKMLML